MTDDRLHIVQTIARLTYELMCYELHLPFGDWQTAESTPRMVEKVREIMGREWWTALNKDIAQFSIVEAAFAIAGDNATAADIMAIIASGAVREPSKGEGA